LSRLQWFSCTLAVLVAGFRLIPVMGRLKCVAAQSRESHLNRKTVLLATLFNISQLKVSPFTLSMVEQRHIKAARILFTPETFATSEEFTGGLWFEQMSLCTVLYASCPPSKQRWSWGSSRRTPPEHSTSCWEPLLGEGEAGGCLHFHDLERALIWKHRRKGAFM